MKTMTKLGAAGTLAIAALCLWQASTSLAAVQGAVDPKFLIKVPAEQRKVKLNGSSAFSDGKLTLGVTSIERTHVTVTVNGGAPIDLGASEPKLVAIEGDNVCSLVYLGKVGDRAILSAACDKATAESSAAVKAQDEKVAVAVVAPMSLVDSTPKGEMKNPYVGDPQAIAEGRSLFLSNSCNGCHGGTGGGGMGPALTNPVWVYGDGDDTLFRLVTLGSDSLQEKGYSRVARETVVGPMPPFGEIIDNSDQLWKILAFVKSLSGDTAAK